MKCKNCGVELDGQVICPLCGEKNISHKFGMKTCSLCHTRIPPGMDECPECGTPVNHHHFQEFDHIPEPEATKQKELKIPVSKNRAQGRKPIHFILKIGLSLFVLYFAINFLLFVGFCIYTDVLPALGIIQISELHLYDSIDQSLIDYGFVTNQNRIVNNEKYIYLAEKDKIIEVNDIKENVLKEGTFQYLYSYSNNMYGLNTKTHEYIDLKEDKVLFKNVEKIYQSSYKTIFLDKDHRLLLNRFFSPPCNRKLFSPVVWELSMLQ